MDGFKKFVELSDELDRRVTNLKSAIRRRKKKFEKVIDPLGKQKIEVELGHLKSELKILQTKEGLFNLSIFEAMFGTREDPKLKESQKPTLIEKNQERKQIILKKP